LKIRYFRTNAPSALLRGSSENNEFSKTKRSRGFNIGTNPATPIQWFIRYRSGFAQGDYDDDADDLAVYRRSEGTFYRRSATSGNQIGAYKWGRMLTCRPPATTTVNFSFHQQLKNWKTRTGCGSRHFFVPSPSRLTSFRRFRASIF
jgi:hypothetical protein